MSTVTTLKRPVVALDLDGVVNAYRMDPLQPGWSQFTVEQMEQISTWVRTQSLS